MKRQRKGIALVIALIGAGIMICFAMDPAGVQETMAQESESATRDPALPAQTTGHVPAPGSGRHHHFDRRKHPTTTDPLRFVTNRDSRVVLPLLQRCFEQSRKTGPPPSSAEETSLWKNSGD